MVKEPTSADATVLEHETVDRLANIVVTTVPAALLGVAIWLAWGGALHWQDLVILAVSYLITGIGITVGFHRLFTHRSFKTTRLVRALFAAFGSAAVEGPVIEWVSTHRKHHRFSDLAGDPHSPHVDHGVGWRGALRGLFHAHIGWLFAPDAPEIMDGVKDLLENRAIRRVDRLFILWVALGVLLPLQRGAVLRHRDELPRRDPPSLGVPPAHEGLNATDATARNIHLRLIMQFELAPCDRSAQCVFDLDALGRLVSHRGRVELEALSAVRLDSMHGDVGVARLCLPMAICGPVAP